MRELREKPGFHNRIKMKLEFAVPQIREDYMALNILEAGSKPDPDDHKRKIEID